LDTDSDNPFARQDLLPERIAQHLRARIASGSVKPSQRLTELELTREYDVSRVPLREAFRILATEGLISLAPHRGATVIPLSEKELRELFGARSAIEEFAARMLAENPTAPVVHELRTLNQNMKAAVGRLDLVAYERDALLFHDTLVQACGNDLLASYYTQVKVRFRRYQAVLAVVPKSAGASIREHERVLLAISRGEADAAAEATRKHIQNLITRFQGGHGLPNTQSGAGTDPLPQHKAGSESADAQ
jgi:DNA-binding GntR family transcriptional regulator